MQNRLDDFMTTTRHLPHASRQGGPRALFTESDLEMFESGRRAGAAIAALLRADGAMPHRAPPAQQERTEDGNVR